MAIVYFYLAYLAAIGLIMDRMLRTLQVWICPWIIKEKDRNGPAVWLGKLHKRFNRTTKSETDHA